ncbi:MAG: EpsI family protein [Candidatus Eisenbacteria bacterium]|nr:EpsI family protein [Candidatus Eisenbacteria bacterium]
MLGRLAPLVFPCLLLGLVGLYRVAAPPGRGAESNLASLPLEIAGLRGVDVPVAEMVLEDLEHDDLLVRRYVRPDGVPIWLVLIYFVNRRLGGHDPQLCYRSQGYRTSELPPLDLETLMGGMRASQFLASKGRRAERVATLWYRPVAGTPEDVRGYRWGLFTQGLRQNRLYGIFIRVSTLETDSPGEADQWNRRFVTEIVRDLPGLIRD